MTTNGAEKRLTCPDPSCAAERMTRKGFIAGLAIVVTAAGIVITLLMHTYESALEQKNENIRLIVNQLVTTIAANRDINIDQESRIRNVEIEHSSLKADVTHIKGDVTEIKAMVQRLVSKQNEFDRKEKEQ